MKLAIYGTGGLGKETFFLANKVMNSIAIYSEIVFIDDTKPCGFYNSCPMLPFSDFTLKYSPADTQIVIAIGEPVIRKKIREKIQSASYELGCLISPDLQRSPDVKIGKGCLIFPGSIFLPGVEIGMNTVIQAGVVLTHDDKLGNDTMVSHHSTFGGSVIVGNQCYIGLASTIRDHIRIGENSIIGMGSVVTKDVESGIVVVGNPAKKIRDNVSQTVFKSK